MAKAKSRSEMNITRGRLSWNERQITSTLCWLGRAQRNIHQPCLLPFTTFTQRLVERTCDPPYSSLSRGLTMWLCQSFCFEHVLSFQNMTEAISCSPVRFPWEEFNSKQHAVSNSKSGPWASQTKRCHFMPFVQNWCGNCMEEKTWKPDGTSKTGDGKKMAFDCVYHFVSQRVKNVIYIFDPWHAGFNNFHLSASKM